MPTSPGELRCVEGAWTAPPVDRPRAGFAERSGAPGRDRPRSGHLANLARPVRRPRASRRSADPELEHACHRRRAPRRGTSREAHRPGSRSPALPAPPPSTSSRSTPWTWIVSASSLVTRSRTSSPMSTGTRSIVGDTCPLSISTSTSTGSSLAVVERAGKTRPEPVPSVARVRGTRREHDRDGQPARGKPRRGAVCCEPQHQSSSDSSSFRTRSPHLQDASTSIVLGRLWSPTTARNPPPAEPHLQADLADDDHADTLEAPCTRPTIAVLALVIVVVVVLAIWVFDPWPPAGRDLSRPVRWSLPQPARLEGGPTG